MSEALRAMMADVTLDALRLTLPQRGLAAGPVDLVIRPEAIRISDAGGGIAATVARETYMGSHTEYHLATPLGELFCVAASQLPCTGVSEVSAASRPSARRA